MSLVEFAKERSPIKLSEWQLQYLGMYEAAEKEGKQLIISNPPRSGKTMVRNLIEEYYNQIK